MGCWAWLKTLPSGLAFSVKTPRASPSVFWQKNPVPWTGFSAKPSTPWLKPIALTYQPVECWWLTLIIGMHEKYMNYALMLSKGPTIDICPNSLKTPMLYFPKLTYLTFSSQIPTKSVNLKKFLTFPYMRNIWYMQGILNSHENYHIFTMRNGKTTEIFSSL